MILAEDEVAIGTDHDGIMVLDDDLVPGTPLADVLPIATDVLELEITPNRPDCLSVYGVAREVHAATGAPLEPPPWADDPGHRRPGRGRQHRGPRLRAVPALHRAPVRERHDRPVAGLAEGAPDGRRPAPDQQRRRHHQLRDAAHRPAAARVRLGPRGRRAPRRPARRRRREDVHARRRRADAGQRHAADRRRRRADVDRRDHGRPALRGPAEHDARPDGGGELERPEPAADLVSARPAHGGLRALREGPAAGADDGRPGARGAADARADRRDAAAAARSTSAGRARRRRRSGCATRRSRGCSAPRSRSASSATSSSGSSSASPTTATASTSPSRTSAATTSRARST